jgi:hypothetical protein
MSNDFKAGYSKELAGKIFLGMDNHDGCIVTPTLLGVMVSGKFEGVKCTDIIKVMTNEQSSIMQKLCDNEEYQSAAKYIESLKGDL